jgi:hypothetical protein
MPHIKSVCLDRIGDRRTKREFSLEATIISNTYGAMDLFGPLAMGPESQANIHPHS